MATVNITADATDELAQVPLPIQNRIVNDLFPRLARWPAVSGAKPLRGRLAGSYRIRTGDYRVVFTISHDTVTVWKIGYRGDVYD